MSEEQRERSVEAVLARSYHDLNEVARARFRQLGAIAPETSSCTKAAGGVWECSLEDAWEQLVTFADQGLLQRVAVPDEPDESRWQQHGLIRAYALALLRAGNEADAARARHAAVHSALIEEADDKQIYYRLFPDHPQLVHAFAWAVDHDVPLAANLAANTANLQAAFGLVRFSYKWATRLLSAAETTGDRRLYAAALGTLGNARSALAELPRQNRPARLREALAAYDAALMIHTPQVAPLDHAMVQYNKGNVLQRLAKLPDESRESRLREALAAYDIALQYRTPEVAPLDHALTQENKSVVLRRLAEAPGEDRMARLREALRSGWIAFQIFGELGLERHRRVARDNLREIRRLRGADFPCLWAELEVGEPLGWLDSST